MSKNTFIIVRARTEHGFARPTLSNADAHAIVLRFGSYIPPSCRLNSLSSVVTTSHTVHNTNKKSHLRA